MTKQKNTFIWCVLCLSVITITGAAKKSAVPLWGRWEQSFQAHAKTNPDPSIGLIVRLIAPSGKIHKVSAFWDGDKIWRVRFMPNEIGRWRYRTIAYPDYAGLNAQRGSFRCRTSKSDNRFLQHGAVQISQSGTHLQHADGTPFFWLGDTAWNGALLAKKDDWNIYLADRVNKNFSAVQFVTTPWRSAPTNAEGEVAFTGKEKVQLNPKFFQRLDARIDAVNAQGLLAVPVLLWAIQGDENPGWYLPEEQAILLEKYLVARYGAHHVVWIPAGDTTYRAANGERWRRICRAVFDGTHHAPIVMHPQGMQSYTDFFRTEKWLSIVGYQSGHGDNDNTLQWIHSGPIAQEWQSPPAHPFINLEPPYEDHVAYHSKQRQTAYNVRRACYWSLLNAPTAGLSYGAHGIWSWETEAQEPLLHPGTGVAQPWSVALKFPGSSHMKIMQEIFASLRWWELRPAQNLIAQQNSNPAQFIAAAKTANGDTAIIYLPTGGAIEITAQAHTAVWIDPRTGHRQNATITANKFTAPDAQDWVLVLQLR